MITVFTYVLNYLYLENSLGWYFYILPILLDFVIIDKLDGQ